MKKGISLFVIFLLCSLYSSSSNDHLINEIKSRLGSIVAKEQINPDSFELAFDEANPSKRFVSGTREGIKVLLKLHCETDREEITLEGLSSEQEVKDFSQSASDFVNKLKQIKTKPDEIKALIKETLANLNTFDEIKIESPVDEGTDIKLVIIYQEKPIDILITLNEFELDFRSPFFEQKFSISAPTEEYIKEQIKRVFENMVPHVRRSKLFSKTESIFPMNKTTCRSLYAKESAVSALIKRLYPQIEIPEIELGQGGSIQFPSSGTLTCKETTTSEISYVTLNFDFLERLVESQKMNFLAESMYPLEYIAEAFLENLFRLVSYIEKPENSNESITLYRPNEETLTFSKPTIQTTETDNKIPVPVEDNTNGTSSDQSVPQSNDNPEGNLSQRTGEAQINNPEGSNSSGLDNNNSNAVANPNEENPQENPSAIAEGGEIEQPDNNNANSNGGENVLMI